MHRHAPQPLAAWHACMRCRSEFNTPCRTNKYPREIPELPWYRTTIPQMLMAGFLPFSAIYVELYYIFASVWGHKVRMARVACMRARARASFCIRVGQKGACARGCPCACFACVRKAVSCAASLHPCRTTVCTHTRGCARGCRGSEGHILHVCGHVAGAARRLFKVRAAQCMCTIC